MKIVEIKLKNIINKVAFTLVELLVSMAITSIMLILTTNIVVNLIRNANKADLSSEIDRSSNYIMETLKKNIRQVSTSSNFQLKNWDLHTSTFIPCITNTDCTAAWINSKAFYFDSNTQYLSQCDFSPPISPSTNPTITNCNNMLGHEVALSSFKISFQDSFAQITLKIYDINHIVYPASQPFELVSGVLTKFIN